MAFKSPPTVAEHLKHKKLQDLNCSFIANIPIYKLLLCSRYHLKMMRSKLDLVTLQLQLWFEHAAELLPSFDRLLTFVV